MPRFGLGVRRGCENGRYRLGTRRGSAPEQRAGAWWPTKTVRSWEVSWGIPSVSKRGPVSMDNFLKPLVLLVLLPHALRLPTAAAPQLGRPIHLRSAEVF